MRSPLVRAMVEQGLITEEDSRLYSDLQVMQSGAGYYIGTSYTNKEHFPDIFQEPGSRDSYHYYPSQEEAQAALDNQDWLQRDRP